MTRWRIATVTMILLCAGCTATPEQPPEEAIAGCCTPTTTTTDMVKATIGQAVTARWQSGAGTVTVENAYWADEDVRQQIEAKWGQPAQDGLLVLDVTYRSASGTVPVSRSGWRVKATTEPFQGEMSVFGLAGPDNPPPSEYSRRELPDGAHLPAGEALNGLIAFDVPEVPSEVYLSDMPLPGHINRLALWLIDPAHSATTTTATSTP